MTTVALPSIDWIRLTIGDQRIDLAPSPGIQLRLSVEPMPDDRGFGLLDAPRPSGLRVAVDLIPVETTSLPLAEAVARCESKAAGLAASLGAGHSPLSPLREFSLEAALGGDGLPYNRMSAPRLTLLPGGPPALDEDQAVPAVRVFAATARADGGGSKYVLRLVD